ncbi:Thioredoxin-like fold [Phaffia rhodozyma]|uniref:Thioredoxin-like fold n=1 Tax=Phaffia rhodozyma TaxID=264483 RepID=A0A0F7SQK0_PHARH|nr:Thioredoxin-like fold [Phaffia rhodozyma]
MTSTDSAKPAFYFFEGSAWSTAPRLAIEELGYDLKKDLDLHSLPLGEGANFDPSYLKLAKEGTVPALVDLQGEVLDSTFKVVKYLVANSPKRITLEPSSPNVIEAVHSDQIDPNDALLGYAVDDESRKAKGSDLPGQFWNGRQQALEKYAKSSPPEFKNFYEEKIKYNSYFVKIYSGEASDEELKEYYAKGKKLWSNIGSFLSGDLVKFLQNDRKGTFFAGNTPGEVDFHVIAWLARIITSGGGVEGVEKLTGKPLDKSVKGYYESWTSRESFKKLEIV